MYAVDCEGIALNRCKIKQKVIKHQDIKPELASDTSDRMVVRNWNAAL